MRQDAENGLKKKLMPLEIAKNPIPAIKEQKLLSPG
jgi:hypothetical protein